MVAVVPTIVEKRSLGWDAMTGTPRKLVNIYIEASSGQNYTLDVATYVPNLLSIACITGTSTLFASVPTFSDTTLTFATTTFGTQKTSLLGFY